MTECPPVIIVLDHVKPENIRSIPDRRGGSTYISASATGAAGRERDHQDDAAEILKEELEKLGVSVEIKAPEEFGNYEDYDAYIRSESNKGHVVIPFHFDAEVGKGGTGFLTRIRSGDIEDRELAERIEPMLESFQRDNPELGNYRVTDTAPNATLNVAASGPATLIEFGSMVAWENHYGKDFTSSSKFRQLSRMVARAIVGEKTPPRVSPTGW